MITDPSIVLIFLIGVAASFFATLLWSLISIRLPKLSKIKNTSINGFWVGRFPYQCRPGRDAFNIFRVKERRGRVRLYIEHYNNTVKEPHKLTGIGMFNPPLFSAIYRFEPSFVNQSGTLTLRLRQTGDGTTVLVGICSQIIEIDLDNGSRLEPNSEPYALHRIRLPLSTQMRALIGRSFYDSYTDVLGAYGRLCSPEPTPE